jgi:putative membrane protein
MNLNRVSIVLIAAGLTMLPPVLLGQTDPNSNTTPNSYPQSPQNINSPSGLPGSTPPTGAQASPPTSMRDSLGAPGQTGQQMMDKKFVRAAAEGGIANVKLATLAVEKGSTPGVKDLAQKMVDDHTTINKGMAGVADALGVMLPKKMSKEDQVEYEKLDSLSGKDFDTEYVTYIAKAHWQTLHSFYMEASVAADADLQAEVVKALETMHQHGGMISKTAKDEGITLPPRPPRPGQTNQAKQ